MRASLLASEIFPTWKSRCSYVVFWNTAETSVLTDFCGKRENEHVRFERKVSGVLCHKNFVLNMLRQQAMIQMCT